MAHMCCWGSYRSRVGKSSTASFQRCRGDSDWSGVLESRKADIANIESAYNCKVLCCKCDITDYDKLEKTFEYIKADVGKLDCTIQGIFQGAGILDSCLVQMLSREKLISPMTPKILGTLNLHIVTKDLNLGYFVMQSSITSLIGNVGQSAYGAGNAFMDAFALWRRNRNLNAHSINWGALKSEWLLEVTLRKCSVNVDIFWPQKK